MGNRVTVHIGVAGHRKAHQDLVKVGGGIRDLGNIISDFQGLMAGLSIGILVNTAREQFKTYETATTDMAKVTERDLGLIKQEIIQLPSVLGDSTSLMQGYYQTISAGITGVAESQDFLVTAAKASNAAHVEQGEVVKALSKTMAGYGDEIKDATQAADLLFSIEKVGQTSVAELVPVIGDLASVSHEANVSQHEMAGSLALITQTSGSTAEAATKYKAILMELLKPSKELGEAIAQTGAASGDALIQQRGFIGALEALDGVAASSGQSLSKLFGSQEASLGVTALQAEGYDKLRRSIDAVKEGTGSMDAAFEKWKGTSEAIEQAFTATIGKIAIGMGERLAPAINSSMQLVTKVLTENEQAVYAFGDALVTVAQIAAVGGALYAVPILFTTISGAVGVAGTALAGMGTVMAGIIAHMHAGTGIFAALNTSLYGTQASALAASGALGALKVAGGVLFAAFAGWQIGSWLSDNFETARIAGVMMIDSLMKGWLGFEHGTKIIWQSIKLSYFEMIDGLRGALGDFLAKTADSIQKLPGIGKGMASGLRFSAEGLQAPSEAVQDHTQKLVEMEAQYQKSLKTHNDVIDSLLRTATGYKGADPLVNEHTETLVKNTEAVENNAKAVAESTKVIASAKVAKDRVRLDKEALRAEKQRKKSIADILNSLKKENETYGMTNAELLEYKLNTLGANEADVQAALAMQAKTDALRAQAEAQRELLQEAQARDAEFAADMGAGLDFQREMEEQQAALDEYEEQRANAIGEQRDQYSNFLTDFAEDGTRALVNFATGGRNSFSDMMSDWGSRFKEFALKVATEKIVVPMVMDLFGEGSGIGGFLSQFLGGEGRESNSGGGGIISSLVGAVNPLLQRGIGAIGNYFFGGNDSLDFSFLNDAFGSAGDFLSDSFGSVGDYFNDVFNEVEIPEINLFDDNSIFGTTNLPAAEFSGEYFRDGNNDLSSRIGNVDLFLQKALDDGTGHGADGYPAVLHPGESVFTAEETEKLRRMMPHMARGEFYDIDTGTIQYFRDGNDNGIGDQLIDAAVETATGYAKKVIVNQVLDALNLGGPGGYSSAVLQLLDGDYGGAALSAGMTYAGNAIPALGNLAPYMGAIMAAAQGNMTGAMGMAGGATVGSAIMPGIGTAIGALIGGILTGFGSGDHPALDIFAGSGDDVRGGRFLGGGIEVALPTQDLDYLSDVRSDRYNYGFADRGIKGDGWMGDMITVFDTSFGWLEDTFGVNINEALDARQAGGHIGIGTSTNIIDSATESLLFNSVLPETIEQVFEGTDIASFINRMNVDQLRSAAAGEEFVVGRDRDDIMSELLTGSDSTQWVRDLAENFELVLDETGNWVNSSGEISEEFERELEAQRARRVSLVGPANVNAGGESQEEAVDRILAEIARPLNLAEREWYNDLRNTDTQLSTLGGVEGGQFVDSSSINDRRVYEMPIHTQVSTVDGVAVSEMYQASAEEQLAAQFATPALYEELKKGEETLLETTMRVLGIVTEVPDAFGRILEMHAEGLTTVEAIGNFEQIQAAIHQVDAFYATISSNEDLNKMREMIAAQEEYIQTIYDLYATEEELSIIRKGQAAELGLMITGLDAKSLSEALWDAIRSGKNAAEFAQGIENDVRAALAKTLTATVTESISVGLTQPINEGVGMMVQQIIAGGFTTGSALQEGVRVLVDQMETVFDVLQSEEFQDFYRELSESINLLSPASITQGWGDFRDEINSTADSISDLLAPFRKIIRQEGMSDVARTVDDLNAKYAGAAEQIKQSGFAPHVLERHYEVLNQAKEIEMRRIGESVLTPIQELVEKAGMTEIEWQTKMLDAKYDQIKADLILLGLYDEDLVNKAKEIELNNILNNTTEALTENINSLLELQARLRGDDSLSDFKLALLGEKYGADLTDLSAQRNAISTFLTSNVKETIAWFESLGVKIGDFSSDISFIFDNIQKTEDEAQQRVNSTRSVYKQALSSEIKRLESELGEINKQLTTAKNDYVYYLNEEIKVQQDLADNARNAADELKGLSESMGDYLQSLSTDNATITPDERYAAAFSEWQSVVRDTKSSDLETAMAAMGRLNDVSAEWLDASQEANANVNDYNADLAAVRAVLTTSMSVAELQAGKQNDMADAAEEQVKVLENIVDSVNDVYRAVEDLAAAEAAYATAQLALDKSNHVVQIGEYRAEIEALDALTNAIVPLNQALANYTEALALQAEIEIPDAPPVSVPVTDPIVTPPEEPPAPVVDTGPNLRDVLYDNGFTFENFGQWAIANHGNPQYMIDTLHGYGITEAKQVATALSIGLGRTVSTAEVREALPGFAAGGYHAGGLRIVGEDGPELEFTGPSRIMNNRQTMDILGKSNSDVVEAIRDLKDESKRLLAELVKTNKKVATLLDRRDLKEPPGESLDVLKDIAEKVA